MAKTRLGGAGLMGQNSWTQTYGSYMAYCDMMGNRTNNTIWLWPSKCIGFAMNRDSHPAWDREVLYFIPPKWRHPEASDIHFQTSHVLSNNTCSSEVFIYVFVEAFAL